MHRDNIGVDLKDLAFEFFFRFSRFEFALKENGNVKAGPRGYAQPDWDSFIDENGASYTLSTAAKELLEDPPDVQRYRNERLWEWAPLTFGKGQSDLSKLVLIVKTVRNNLFHGGKHSAEGWDDPKRVRFLLGRSIEVLDALAVLAGYEADYLRVY